jgi:hypothetical protein
MMIGHLFISLYGNFSLQIVLLVVVILVAVADAQDVVAKEDLALSESKAKHHVVFVYDGSSYGNSYGSSGSSYSSSGSSYGSSYDDGYEVKVKGKGKSKGKSKGLRTTYGYDGPSYSPISYDSSYGGSSYGGDGNN